MFVSLYQIVLVLLYINLECLCQRLPSVQKKHLQKKAMAASAKELVYSRENFVKSPFVCGKTNADPLPPTVSPELAMGDLCSDTTGEYMTIFKGEHFLLQYDAKEYYGKVTVKMLRFRVSGTRKCVVNFINKDRRTPVFFRYEFYGNGPHLVTFKTKQPIVFETIVILGPAKLDWAISDVILIAEKL